jgi:hypothetical protein
MRAFWAKIAQNAFLLNHDFQMIDAIAAKPCQSSESHKNHS